MVVSKYYIKLSSMTINDLNWSLKCNIKYFKHNFKYIGHLHYNSISHTSKYKDWKEYIEYLCIIMTKNETLKL